MLIDGKPLVDYTFFQNLIAMPVIEEVYLTSSRARGESGPFSDIDLAIMCPMASDEEWWAIHKLVRYNHEILLRIDPIRLDKVTDVGHRNFLMHKRQALYLKTYCGDDAIVQGITKFFNDWQDKLQSWIARIPLVAGTPNKKQLQDAMDAFHIAFDCIWVIVRKCITLHGLHINTPLSTFREACMAGWIDDRFMWERMTQDYRARKEFLEEKESLVIYSRFPNYIAAMRQANKRIMSIMQPYIADSMRVAC